MSDKPSRVPFVEGNPGPIGYVLAEFAGERFWVAPGDESITPGGESVSVLTPSQRERVKEISFVFREHLRDEGGVKEAIAQFEMDDDPEKEICIWEAGAFTYKQELKRRPGASPRQRQLLYFAILGCMTAGSSVDDLLSQRPALKALSRLARVGETYAGHRRASSSPPLE